MIKENFLGILDTGQYQGFFPFQSTVLSKIV